MNTILKLEHIQKYYGNEGNITKAIIIALLTMRPILT